MTGNAALLLTDRDKVILEQVARFGALTRDQLVRLGLFASKSRANERLGHLAKEELLRTIRQPLLAGGPRLVYLPSKPTGDGPDFSRASLLFLEHHLGVSDIRIAFERSTEVTRWLTDRELSRLKLGVVPDAFVQFALNGRVYGAFIEFDRHTEILSRIAGKVRAYLDLAFTGRFEKAFGLRFFRLLFITESPRRLQTVSTAVARITDKVVRLTTRSELLAQGPAAMIWRRPGSSALEALTN